MNRIINNGPILNKVFENSKFRDAQKISNLDNAEKIYSKVPNSINNYNSNVGLVVGKIQSGKTANVITLSALALDNDCRLIIMLLSDTTNLLDQNYNRIFASFNDCEGVSVFKQSFDGDFKIVDEDCLNKFYKRGEKIIICSLKHYSHINEIQKKIQKTGYSKDYSIFIDDEGDDISQNTSKDKFIVDANGKLVENDRSRNNSAIVNLKKTLTKCGYISLTATPEAPILLQRFQELSPNYCVTLQPGSGYTGLITFHQADSKYVKIIDDYGCLVKENRVPDSLIDAVAFYFAGCIYRKKKKMNSKIHSMMIHPAKEIIKHDNVMAKLKMRLFLIEKSFYRKEESGMDFLEQVKTNYKEISSEKDDIDYDDLKSIFDSYKISSINGDSPEKDITKLTRLFPYNILVGGDLLDRGITIPNLAVSYIIRDSKKGQIDTLLQRARWFGYKDDYIETCRVYMPYKLADKYNSIIDTEESLWDFLNECSDMDYDLHNCDFSLEINSSLLNPTSSSKASFEFGYSNISSVKQQKIFTVNNEMNQENIILTRSYDWEKAHLLDYNKVQKHRYIDLSLNEINTFIDKFHFSELKTSDSLDKSILKKLINENISKYGNTVSLVDMRYEFHEERSVYNKNYVRNLMQGRSEGKKEGEPGHYYGDRYLPEMKNKISLQIHHVKVKVNDSEFYQYGDEVPMLALCMPKDFIIKNFVKRKNIADSDRIY